MTHKEWRNGAKESASLHLDMILPASLKGFCSTSFDSVSHLEKNMSPETRTESEPHKVHQDVS